MVDHEYRVSSPEYRVSSSGNGELEECELCGALPRRTADGGRPHVERGARARTMVILTGEDLRLSLRAGYPSLHRLGVDVSTHEI